MTDDPDPELARRPAEIEPAGPRRRRVTPLTLLVAATVLAALLTTGLVLALDGDEADVATEPTTVTTAPTPSVDDSSTTTSPEPDAGTGPLRATAPPVARGSGEVVAVDPTGRFLYLAAPAPSGDRGCEGVERRALYVETVDGVGDRRLVAPVDLVDATSSLKIRFSAAGEAAIVATCEGFGAGVVTGTLGHDGTLTDPVELELPGVESILDIDFLAPGMLVAATFAPGEDGPEQRVLQFPVGPSEPIDLGYEGVARVAPLPDGRLVTVDTKGPVRIGEDLLGSAVGALDVQVTGDGRWVLVHTVDGVTRFGTDGGGEQRLDAGERSVGMQPTDAGSLVVAEWVGDEQHLRLTELDPDTGQRLGTVFDAVRPGRGFVVAPSDDRLFVSVVRPDRPGDLVVLEVPLAR